MSLGQILFELHSTQVENCKFLLIKDNKIEKSKIPNESPTQQN
jgi:hypothetical protein